MEKIGLGKRWEMLRFVKEVEELVQQGGFNLEVKFEQVVKSKFGREVNTQLAEVYLVGEEQEIQQFLQTV